MRSIAGKAAHMLVLALLAAACAFPACAADPISISVIKGAAYGTIFVAEERGYFAAEGLEPKLVFFEASPPIAVAVLSGDLDIGIGATSAAFFALGDKLRIIGGFALEAPGYQGMTFVASNRGWEDGVRSFKDLAGRSVAIGTIGSSPHYCLALIEEKYGIDPKSVRVLPLQTVSNQVSALVGGQADAGVTISTGLLPALARGDVKLLGYVGDEVAWQRSSMFTTTKLAEDNPDLVARFLRAYRKGARDYIAAFAGPDGKRHDGPTAPAILAIMAKYIGQTPDELKVAADYLDPEARVDVKDLQRQADWYRAQGMLKTTIDVRAVLDQRSVVALP